MNATFKAVDTVPYGTMTARFVVIEKTSNEYPWTAREVASPATVTLSAAGDSAVFSRSFSVSWAVQGELDVLVFLEDTSPQEIINAQIMPFAYNPTFASPDFAVEAGYGETTVHSATLRNSGAVPDTFTVTFSQDALPDGVDGSDWEASYREVGGSWTTDPSVFALLPGEETDLEVRLVDNIGTTSGMAVSSLHAQSAGAVEATALASFATFVGQRAILLVDDDAGATLETHLETALGDTGLAARVWDAAALGRPSLADLSSYWAVLWTTGGSDCLQLTQQDESVMAGYLDQGGNLYLSSFDFLSSHAAATAFMTDYLHVGSWGVDVGGFMMTGVAGDPISGGMSLGLSGGPVPTAGIDNFVLTGGDAIFSAFSTTRGARFEENGHKLVFTAFPFEDVKTATADPSNQKTLVARIIDWFDASTGVDGGDSAGFAKLSLEQNAPNPFNPKTAIAFTIPGGADRATLEVFSVDGRLVATLHDGPVDSSRHVVSWNGRDDRGAGLASGVYFARLAADGRESFRKMTLLK